MAKQRLAVYPNLLDHCSKLAWSRTELLINAGNPCSDRSVKRLEDGEPIRAVSVNKIFAAINKAMEETLNYDEEIKIYSHKK